MYRLMDAELIEPGEMNKRIWALAEIGKIFTVAELEKRLDDLEQRQTLTHNRALSLHPSC